jgi:hypothetical protein
VARGKGFAAKHLLDDPVAFGAYLIIDGARHAGALARCDREMTEVERLTRLGAFDRKEHMAPGDPHCLRCTLAVVFELVVGVRQLRLGHLVSFRRLSTRLSRRGSPPIDSHANARRIASRAVASCASSYPV